MSPYRKEAIKKIKLVIKPLKELVKKLKKEQCYSDCLAPYLRLLIDAKLSLIMDNTSESPSGDFDENKEVRKKEKEQQSRVRKSKPKISKSKKKNNKP